MKRSKENKIGFYAETDAGVYDEIVLDLFEKTYEYNSNIDECELSCRSDSSLKEFLVGNDVVTAVCDCVEGIYGGSYYFAENTYAQRQAEQELYEAQNAKRSVIPKEKIRQAICWKLGKNELVRIISYDFAYEQDDYYNFDLIIDKVHAFMAGEKTVDYFTDWCIVLMRCLLDNEAFCADKDIQLIYNEIADCLDGLAFLSSGDSEEERQKQCKEFIANLKYYDHRINDIKRGITTDFDKNGIVIYVAFVFTLNGGTDEMYSVCVADKTRRTVNYYFAQNVIMEENYNITVIMPSEYETLSSKYFTFKHDPTLNMDSQLKKKNSRR